MDALARKAHRLGATEFGKSRRLHKKWFVVYRGETIHFGDTRYQDFTQHGDPARRKSYRARAAKIRDKNGRLTVNNKYSANYWAYHLLW